MGKTALDLLRESLRGRSLLNVPARDLTTIQVGGPVDLVVYPADGEDLSRLIAFLAEREIPAAVIGNGSNLIVRDGGIRGAVIVLSEGFREVEVLPPENGAQRFRAGAGVNLRRLVRWTVDRGITGFEGLSGIPGSVGGAVAMNAGAWGDEIGKQVLEVECLGADGTLFTLEREQLRFGYRRADLPSGAIVLKALFEGGVADPQEVKNRAQELYRRRRDSQPLQDPSAGSVFRNPPGHKAGALIDQCGLKGVRVGDAEVSRLHANFIVNTGQATASHVVALMGMIQERVYVKHKVKLEPEVRIMGDWEKGKLRIQE